MTRFEFFFTGGAFSSRRDCVNEISVKISPVDLEVNQEQRKNPAPKVKRSRKKKSKAEKWASAAH